MEGKKFRAVPVPLWNSMIKGMGAIPTPVEISEIMPALMTGLFVWLMGWRVLQAYGRGTGFLNLLALAAASGILTALIEAGWYAAATGIDPLRVLQANLSFAYAISPSWWVAGAGLGVAVLSDIALRLRPLPVRRAARA